MPLYDQFAAIYQRGPYLRFSQGLVETVLPDYFEEMGIRPGDHLDVACGEGSLAVAMAGQGFNVTGIDQSEQMIELARARAEAGATDVRFMVDDMRSLPFAGEFDLVTCFFDSLNYMLTVQDLRNAFDGAFHALRPGGYYLFDMNTVYGLAVDWMRQETYIQNETDDFLELHRQEFDYENLVASMIVTVFQKKGELWERFEEVHQERGYPIADIQFLLNAVGFEIVGMYGSLSKRTSVQHTSSRAYFTARKPG
ncbi:MAG: class I SAM-dependent methyltransferase [Chloroflexota bacterium]|nr:class I SAM-dependent methyltransferase [Chloroflexota bacterium]